MIEPVSGWGGRWGAYRHENGLDPTPSGSGPFVFLNLSLPSGWHGLLYFLIIVDEEFRAGGDGPLAVGDRA